jgi:chemotaxis protein histidine kinase CheA
MQFTAKRKTTDDPHDFVVVPPDQVQVAPSDTAPSEAVASDAEITDLLRAAARHRSESSNGEATNRSSLAPVPTVDTRFRATAVNDAMPTRGPTFGRRAMRAVAALLLAMGIGAVALTWQTFGYAAKKALVSWAPKLALTAALPLDKLGLSTESAPANEPAVADATPAAAPAQSTQSAPATPETAAPEKAAANPTASSDTTRLLQSMARDLANVSQEVEILKASLAELKANQQRVSDRAAENAKARVAIAPPRPAVAHKPTALYSPTPASAPAAPPPAYRSPPSYSATTQAAMPPPAPPISTQPYAPPPPTSLQPPAEPGLASPPRPPMPVQ